MMIYFIVWIALGLICGGIAQSKGRNGMIWCGIGLLFSVVGFFAVLLVDDKTSGQRKKITKPQASYKLIDDTDAWEKTLSTVATKRSTYNWPD